MIRISGKTDTGILRDNNEDAFFISESPIGIFDQLIVVCDGMGGHSYGEVASRKAIEAVIEDLVNEPVDNPALILEQAVSMANLAVRKESESRGGQEIMGTTLVIAGIIGNHVYAANIGDSRLYLIDGNDYTITQISHDHTFVEEQVRLGLIERDSEEYEQQKNMITRAVGVYAEVEADQFELTLENNQYLLLCTDGLTNMVSDLVIKNLALDDSFELYHRVETMIDLANRNGGRDNVTLVLAHYTEEQTC